MSKLLAWEAYREENSRLFVQSRKDIGDGMQTCSCNGLCTTEMESTTCKGMRLVHKSIKCTLNVNTAERFSQQLDMAF